MHEAIVKTTVETDTYKGENQMKKIALLFTLLLGACGEIGADEFIDTKQSELINYSWVYRTQVYMRASNGQFLVAEGGGGGDVNANRSALGPWETFGLYSDRNYSNRVAFKTSTGHFLSAEGGGGGRLLANRTAAHEWEAFIFIDRGGGNFALRTYNGKYVTAEGGGGREVNANRTAIGPWETFH
jgi:hypothetical protein